MDILLAKHAGFCYGVRRALAIAEETKSKYDSKVFTYGPLIHNAQEVVRLEGQGIFPVNTPNVSGPLIIRSHGIGESKYQELKTLCKVVDATCPYVSRAQRLGKKLHQEGFQVLIFGDEKHPEVQGLMDWCGEDSRVLQNVEDAENWPSGGKIALLAQTTQTRHSFLEVARILEEKAGQLQVVDTICRATADRQKEALEMASYCDMMIVIGGKHSANTNKLFSIIREAQTPVYHIEKPEELKQEWFRGIGKVGVTAGASTPDWIIKEVICLMDEFKVENEKEKVEAETVDTATSETSQEETPQEETPVVENNEPAAEVAVEAEAENVVAADEAEEDVSEEAVEAEAEEEVAVEPESENVVVADEAVEDVSEEAVEAEAEEEVADEVEETNEGTEENSDELTMADFDLSSSDENYKVGDIVQAIVVQVGTEEVLVDIGAKSEGIVAARELDNIEDLKPGDVLELMLVRKRNKEGAPVLSRKEIQRRKYRDERRKQRDALAKKFDELSSSLDDKTEYEVTVTEEVKGGVVVDLEGLRGFVPASHLEIGYVNDLGQYVGKTLRARIIELDKKKNRIVLSQKEVLAEELDSLKSETWDKLEEGAVVEGKVCRTAKFGAFIDLGGIDGLLHISEMGWNKVEKPEDAVTIGETIKVKVLNVDKEQEKIALSLKALQPNPWTVALEKHPEGATVTGKVLRTTDFGAFVEIEPGFEGLLHISELAHERVEKVEDVVNPGDEVTVKIIKVIPEEKKIGLSIKETLPKPEQPEASSGPAAAKPRNKKVSPRREKSDLQFTDNDAPLTLGDMFGDLLDK